MIIPSNYKPEYALGDIVKLYPEYPDIDPYFHVVVRIHGINHKTNKYYYQFIEHNDPTYLNTFLEYDIMEVDLNSELLTKFVVSTSIWRKVNESD